LVGGGTPTKGEDINLRNIMKKVFIVGFILITSFFSCISNRFTIKNGIRACNLQDSIVLIYMIENIDSSTVSLNVRFKNLSSKKIITYAPIFSNRKTNTFVVRLTKYDFLKDSIFDFHNSEIVSQMYGIQTDHVYYPYILLHSKSQIDYRVVFKFTPSFPKKKIIYSLKYLSVSQPESNTFNRLYGGGYGTRAINDSLMFYKRSKQELIPINF